MQTSHRPLLISCIVFVFCAATAIVAPAQTFTTVHTFCSQPNCADGVFPQGALSKPPTGTFTEQPLVAGAPHCGDYGCGTVFKITPNGTLTTLHPFNGGDGEARRRAGARHRRELLRDNS